jgi:hypothetical protein
MTQNISRKLNLWNMYFEFKKSKKVQVVIYMVCAINENLSPYF